MQPTLNKVFRSIFREKSPAEIKRAYGLPENLNLTLRFTDGWFVVTSADHPGLVTEADTRQSFVEMINDAVLTYYDVPRKESDIVYNKFNIGDQVIQYEGQMQTQTQKA